MNTARSILPDVPPVAERILLIRWSALGDVAIASAAFEDVARAFPGARLDLSTMPPWDALFRCDPRFQRVISIPMRSPGTRFAGVRRWLQEVRSGRYDLVVDLQSNDRSRLLLAALVLGGAGIRHRVGLRPGWPYTIAPAPPLPAHAFERQRAALAAAGIATGTDRPVLHVPPARRRAVQALQSEHGLAPGRYALFLPGSQRAGWLKRWGARRFVALARALTARGVVERVALAGGGDDAAECRAIADAAGGRAANLCGRTEVADLVVLAEGARCVVANDTGTAHVAAAAGRPMVVVCGPTDPARVKPVGPAVTALQAPIYCVNCYRKTCTHHSCMMLLSPEMALAAVEALIA